MSHAICNKHQGRDEYFDIGSNKKKCIIIVFNDCILVSHHRLITGYKICMEI